MARRVDDLIAQNQRLKRRVHWLKRFLAKDLIACSKATPEDG
jgi:hypothetical protein